MAGYLTIGASVLEAMRPKLKSYVQGRNSAGDLDTIIKIGEAKRGLSADEASRKTAQALADKRAFEMEAARRAEADRDLRTELYRKRTEYDMEMGRERADLALAQFGNKEVTANAVRSAEEAKGFKADQKSAAQKAADAAWLDQMEKYRQDMAAWVAGGRKGPPPIPASPAGVSNVLVPVYTAAVKAQDRLVEDKYKTKKPEKPPSVAPKLSYMDANARLAKLREQYLGEKETLRAMEARNPGRQWIAGSLQNKQLQKVRIMATELNSLIEKAAALYGAAAKVDPSVSRPAFGLEGKVDLRQYDQKAKPVQKKKSQSQPSTGEMQKVADVIIKALSK